MSNMRAEKQARTKILGKDGINIGRVIRTTRLPYSSVGKESTCNARGPGLIPGSGRSTGEGKIHWRRDRLPTQVFWPGEFHGLYSPWGCKESDTTEQPSLLMQHIIQWHYTQSTEEL